MIHTKFEEINGNNLPSRNRSCYIKTHSFLHEIIIILNNVKLFYDILCTPYMFPYNKKTQFNFRLLCPVFIDTERIWVGFLKYYHINYMYVSPCWCYQHKLNSSSITWVKVNRYMHINIDFYKTLNW